MHCRKRHSSTHFRFQVNETTYLTTSTDSSLFRTKVSPTLPIISKYDITTESGTKNQSDEGTCISTGLALCRGVMPYDLTISNKKKLTALEYHHFQYLLSSECSARVSEFVCAVLEPECRPTRMGTLEPCKRICKCEYLVPSDEERFFYSDVFRSCSGTMCSYYCQLRGADIHFRL